MPTTKFGLTLLELIVCTLIVGILSATAMPLAKNVVRRQKEALLRDYLKEMRQAIDRYHERKSLAEPGQADAKYYPRSLEELIEQRLLRRIPIDPFTEKADWQTRSSTDPIGSPFSNNENLFDVFSSSEQTDLNGKPYASW